MKKIMKKTKSMKQIETKLGEDVEEVMRRLYVDEHKSAYEICEILDLSYVTVLNWLQLAGVRSRKLNVH